MANDFNTTVGSLFQGMDKFLEEIDNCLNYLFLRILLLLYL